MATKQVLLDLLAARQAAGEIGVDCVAVGGVDAAKRVRADEAFDAVVLAAASIDQLVAEGHLLAGSRVDLFASGIEVAVPADASPPDLHSESAVRAAVLAAPSIGYSTGPSGVYLAQLFERWGIADQVQRKLVQAKPGVPVASLIASGEVALGFQQRSELMFQQGIRLLGALPSEIQLTTIFAGAVSATSARVDDARALLEALAAPDAGGIKQRNGMDGVRA